MTISKLPLAKDLDGFEFAGTPINEALVRDLSNGGFLAEQRNAVLIGGTGTGKSHLAIAIARACIRGGARGRFYNVVDLVNRLDSEARAGRQGRGGQERPLAAARRASKSTPIMGCRCTTKFRLASVSSAHSLGDPVGEGVTASSFHERSIKSTERS